MRGTRHGGTRLGVLRATAVPGALNAIESIEVRDADEPSPFLRQRTLFVRCLRPIIAALDFEDVRIDGGNRVPVVPVAWAARADADPAALALSPDTTELAPGPAEWHGLVAGIDPADRPSVLVVRTEARGDFSQYRLRLVDGAGSNAPPQGFDPMLASIEFGFKVECATDVDCLPVRPSATEPVRDADIDYLAKDYEGFRRVMIERMAMLAPEWLERSSADLGITLVEALAYLGDQLSYRQDAIATEAYLQTARSRVSLRRHARLVDYRVHEGESARVWAQVAVTGAAPAALPARTVLGTRVPGLPGRVARGSDDERRLVAEATLFETVDATVLHPQLDWLEFHTWGEPDARLEAGATRGTLRGRHPQLRVGDVLLIVELERVAPLDPPRRAAVRVVSVEPSLDPSGGLFEQPPTAAAVAVTEIGWHADDALPFAVRLASPDVPGPLAVARGNVVLADQGRSVEQWLARIGAPPLPSSAAAEDHEEGCECGCGGRRLGDPPAAPRYRPRLLRGPLTHRTIAALDPFATIPSAGAAGNALAAELALGGAPTGWQPVLEDLGVRVGRHTRITGSGGAWTIGWDEPGAPAAEVRAGVQVLLAGPVFELRRLPVSARAAERSAPRAARPAIELTDDAGQTWLARADLLASGPDDPHFVVETEHDGTVALRFSRSANGRIPDRASVFLARYRVGNGAAGRIGAGALAHVVSDDAGIEGVANELASFGAMEPETREQVLRDAPEAYRVQERAVTDADYAMLAGAHPGVHRVAVTRRWTGSWHTVFVSADRLGGVDVDPAFEDGLRARLERFRLAGIDLEVDGARNVPIEVDVRVCALPRHSQSGVRAGVSAALTSGVRPDGSPGLFHPDRRTLGEPVRVSEIIAAAQAVPGVASVEVATFQRLRQPDTSGLTSGRIDIGPLEVARLDDDPNFPELGVLTVRVWGGR